MVVLEATLLLMVLAKLLLQQDGPHGCSWVKVSATAVVGSYAGQTNSCSILS
jgi:hypothetical protein